MDNRQEVFMLKALADDTRLSIVQLLTNGEHCACKILEHYSITQPTLSYHMKILCESGLVTARRDGAWMHYALNREPLEQLNTLIKALSVTVEKSGTEGCGCHRNGAKHDCI